MINTRQCDYVFLSHPHADHTCNLPVLNSQNGFNGRIFSSRECLAITKELVKNSGKIHESDIQSMRLKGIRKRPLYTKEQMWDMFDKMEAIPQEEVIELDEQVSVRLYKNGHVFGANSIMLFIKDADTKRVHTLFYTGDMPCEATREFHPYTTEFNYPKKADIVISEATYSDKNRTLTRRDAIKEREELKKLIITNLNKSEKSQIGCFTFSFGRTQEFITWLYDEFKDNPFFDVIIDGVLVNGINNVYLRELQGEELKKFKEVMSWSCLKVNSDIKGTQAILSHKTKRIVITSSGFLTGGRATIYLPTITECSKDTILLLGYSGGQDSLANVIYRTPIDKPVKMFNRTILRKADMAMMRTWSSHKPYNELMEFFNDIHTSKIIIHHCDEENKQKFCSEANEYLRERNKTTRVIPVTKGSFEFIF